MTQSGVFQTAKKILMIVSPNMFYFLKRLRYENKYLPAEFMDHIRRLSKNDVVLDIGANVGLVTEVAARRGARVIAFEPNKYAFSKLRLVAEKFDNVETHNVAAGAKHQKVKLYLHKDSNLVLQDLSESSSLLKSKLNVSDKIFEEIQEIDFAEYLKNINTRIEIMKIDIEGYEIELINHLLDNRSLENIEKIYVETHEQKFTDLALPTKSLKARILSEGYEDKFFWDWH